MATINDVAQVAGVSPAAVSRYLNKRLELPPATASRIESAIRTLDYRPNLMARRLSTGKTEAVALVTPEIREPFFAELASAVEDEAERHGYTVFISSTRSDRNREIAALNRLQDHHVDGLILMTNTPDDGTLATLIGKRTNIVLIDEDVPGPRVPRVFVENTAGAREATLHLIGAGHRAIGFIGGPVGLFSAEERRSGYLQAMRESGIVVRDDLIRVGSFSPDFATRTVLDFLGVRTPPTAVFASSDYLTIGALKGLAEAGVSFPDDISIVGFDDVAVGALLRPPLTAVRQPIEALGRRGFLALLALMTGRKPRMTTRLPVELIVRGSVAAPRKRRTRK